MMCVAFAMLSWVKAETKVCTRTSPARLAIITIGSGNGVDIKTSTERGSSRGSGGYAGAASNAVSSSGDAVFQRLLARAWPSGTPDLHGRKQRWSSSAEGGRSDLLTQPLQRSTGHVIGAVAIRLRLVLAGPPEASTCHSHGAVKRRDRVEHLNQIWPAVNRLDLAEDDVPRDPAVAHLTTVGRGDVDVEQPVLRGGPRHIVLEGCGTFALHHDLSGVERDAHLRAPDPLKESQHLRDHVRRRRFPALDGLDGELHPFCGGVLRQVLE